MLSGIAQETQQHVFVAALEEGDPGTGLARQVNQAIKHLGTVLTAIDIVANEYQLIWRVLVDLIEEFV